jgi:hypothetical protein
MRHKHLGGDEGGLECSRPLEMVTMHNMSFGGGQLPQIFQLVAIIAALSIAMNGNSGIDFEHGNRDCTV